jgi:hypothetical protein
MLTKTFVSLLAIAPRRKLVASAIIYGLSMAVRFTSATGEQVEIPAQSSQGTYPVMSLLVRDRAELPYAEWSANGPQPTFFRYHRLERTSSLPSCSAP